MALYEQLLLGLNVVTLLVCFATLIFMTRNRNYEKSDYESGINGIIYSIFAMLLIFLIQTLKYIDVNYHANLVPILPEITTYIGYLTNIADLVLAPLFAICLLVGIFLTKESIE